MAAIATNGEIARSFFRRIVERATDLMSDEHFTVDGTLIEACASQKSFQRKDGGTLPQAQASAKRKRQVDRDDRYDRHRSGTCVGQGAP